MKNKLPKHMNHRLSLYIVTMFLFIMSIIIMNGFESSVENYYEESISTYKDSRWDSFQTNLKAVRALGFSSLTEKSERIQHDIKTNLDMRKLKNTLDNNSYYSDFDNILRNYLQTNAFNNKKMDQNRNSIFVICNGKIIANYAHDSLYGIPYREGEIIEGNDLRTIIEQDYYNKELSLKALDLINSQSADLIIWQARKPSNLNAEKYNTLSSINMRQIFEEEGIDGFESYEFLLPVYITDYGNIFGEFDVTSDANKSNKLIIIQRLNVKDYFTSTIPGSDILTEDKLISLVDNYIYLGIIIHLFETILYISIIMYILFVVFSINQLLEDAKASEGLIDRRKRPET